MRKQDQLVHLIKSLTAAEKKFFSEYAAKNKTRQSYMKLYEELQKMDVYDAALLCKKLKKTKANLAHEKDYLQEVLYRALREIHADTPDIRMNNTINTIIVLTQRGEFEMAHDLIRKALKEAHKNCDFYVLQRLYNSLMHVTWYMKQNNEEKFNERRGYIALMRESLQGASDLLDGEQLKLRVSELWKKSAAVFSPEDIDEIKQILASDFINKEHVHPIFQTDQVNIASTLYLFLGNPKLALEYKQKELEIIEQYPRESQVDEQYYVFVLKTIASLLQKAEMINEAEAFLNKISTRYYHQLPFNKIFLDKTLDALYFESMMALYQTQYRQGAKNKKDVEQLLHKFEQSWSTLKEAIVPVAQILLFSTVARLAFLIEDYDTSLRWFQMIIDNSESDGSGDILINSRMASALIQYEFGNYTVAKSMAAMTSNFIRKIRPLTQSERSILGFLSNAWRKTGKGEHQAAFRSLQKELNALAHIPAEQGSQKSFYYEAWIKRNLEK